MSGTAGGGVASLSFEIDSSQAQRAIAVLESMRATSIAVTQSTQQLTSQTSNLSQAYGQERDALVRLTEQTRAYDGTLQGLVTRMNELRTGVLATTQQFQAYTDIMKQATAISASFNATVSGLENYVIKAQQLRVQTQDLATGLANITAALQNQTQQGFQTRVMLEQLGVSLRGIGADRPDLVLQRLADSLRGTRFTAQTIAGVEGILGPIGAQAVQSLAQQPYIPYRQRTTTEIYADQQAQMAAQAAANQRRDIDTARLEAERADLRSRYSQDPTIWGRLGLNFDPYRYVTQTRAEELEVLRRIQSLPPEQRQAYTGIGTQIGDFFQTGWAGRQFRRFSNFGSNFQDIQSRFGADVQTGFWSALGTAAGRTYNALTGDYRPSTLDTRPMSVFERRRLQREFGAQIGGLGDPSIAEEFGINEELDSINAPGQRERLIQSLQVPPGWNLRDVPFYRQRRLSNITSALQQRRSYLRDPGQAIQDEISRRRYVLSLDPSQRALGQAAIANLPPGMNVPGIGMPLEALLGDLSLNPSQRGAPGFQQEQAGAAQERSEEVNRQIQFQRELADQLQRGRGAAEDFYRSWTQFTSVLLSSSDAEKANVAGFQAMNLGIQQRITQGRQLIATMQAENQVIRDQLSMTAGTTGLDPITRRSAELSADIEADRRRLVEAGQLPNPEGGEYQIRDASGRVIGTRRVGGEEARQVNAQYVRTRQQQAGVQGQQSVRSLQIGQQGQIEDAQRMVQIMREQALTAQQAAAQVERENALREAITKQLQDQSMANRDNLALEQQRSNEAARLVSLTQQQARNIETLQNTQFQTAGNQALMSLPPQLRGVGQQLLPFFQQQLGAAGVGPLAPNARPFSFLPNGGGIYSAYFAEAERANGLPPGTLSGIASIETGGTFDPRLVNPDGNATGLMGIRRSTALQPGGGVMPIPLSDRTDPAASIAFGGQLLASYRRQAGGDLGTAIRRYSGGGYYIPGQGTAGGLTQDEIADRFRRFVLGENVDLSFLPPEMQAQARAQRDAALANQRSGQDLQTTQAGDAARARIAANQAQGRILAPGARALIIPTDPTLPPEVDAQRRQQQVSEILSGQARDALLGAGTFAQQTGQGRLQADALNESAARYKEVTAQIAAFNRAQQDASHAVSETTLRIQEQDRQLQQAQLDLAGSNRQLADRNELQQALNDRGIFSNELDQDATRRRVQLAQRFRDNPGLADTQQGRDAVAALGRTDIINANTQQMNDLRDAARGAENAVVSTLENVIIRGQRSHFTLRNLVQDFAQLAVNAAIVKPLENALGNLFSTGSTGSIGGIFGFLGRLGGGSAAAAGAGGGLAAAQGSELLSMGIYAQGGVFAGGIDKLANQVITRPTMFKAYAQGGIMGENGPEAIVPLVRGSDGNLGVRSGGGGPQITIHTPININSGGGSNGQAMDPAAMKILQQKIDQTVRLSVQGVLTEQRRPGGQLFYG